MGAKITVGGAVLDYLWKFTMSGENKISCRRVYTISLQIVPLSSILMRGMRRLAKSLLRLVLFLYIIRCPQALHRIGSRGLISFSEPQSAKCHSDCLRDEIRADQHTNTASPVLEVKRIPWVVDNRWYATAACLADSWRWRRTSDDC